MKKRKVDTFFNKVIDLRNKHEKEISDFHKIIADKNTIIAQKHQALKAQREIIIMIMDRITGGISL